MMNTSIPSTRRSEQLFKEAQHYMPGGVNSPVRAFKAVGGTPRFINQAQGAYLMDVDHTAYLDFVGSWGAIILGHNHPTLRTAAQQAISQGLSFGTPCEHEIILAKKIIDAMPSLEKIRFVNSGTEATMSAIRLARAVTGRDKIIKFEGGYHGHTDTLLVKAGSGALTFGMPDSPGVTAHTAADTLVATFNDLSSVTQLFEQYNDIAAIIIEPIAANMNVVPAQLEFLKELRLLCNHYGALLIFDEVITGFRVGPQGAQGWYGVEPDLTTLGKIIGGGLPIGAYGGRAKWMDAIAPQGPVYQAGTLAGNPVVMAVGCAALTALNTPTFYDQLKARTEQWTTGLLARATAAGIPLLIHSVCGLFGLLFTEQPTVSRFNHVLACNRAAYRDFFHAMLQQKVYLAPSAFEAGFMSAAHDTVTIKKALLAAEEAWQV